MIQLPLVVDLDGTLILTDVLHESVLHVLHNRPLDLAQVPFWLAQGKAVLKKNLAARVDLQPHLIPYNEKLLDWLKAQRAAGRPLILCTAADLSIAEKIAAHLELFDEVIASDGIVNLEGQHKANKLVERFGQCGFDYVGNSKKDLAVWAVARRAIVVNASKDTLEKVPGLCEVDKIFSKNKLDVFVWLRVLRGYQWLKNLLLFVPLIAAHHITDGYAWLALFFAFIAFSLGASAGYVANDLLDLTSDRSHPRKRKRPFAAGLVSIEIGVYLFPILLILAIAIGSIVGSQFVLCLLIYMILTAIYSWKLKSMLLIDCITLAVLYTLRIIAGATAVGLPLSFWLLAISVFLFLSLAFVKRYTELKLQLLNQKDKIHGHGYSTSDAPMIQTMGIVSGYASAVILALYLNSDAVIKLYQSPALLWGAVPVLLFWISWMWLQASRGKMHDDPLIFAVKDPASLFAGAVFSLVVLVGAVVSI